MRRRLARISADVTTSPAAAVAAAAALLLASLALALYNERADRLDSMREAQVQAEILAASVAAPLAFDDRTAAQEYVNALRANPAVEAAAAYTPDGAQAVAYHRAGAPAPRVVSPGPPRFDGPRLTVTRPVVQGTTHLGAVYLRIATETTARRLIRYLGIGLVVVMASLLVGLLGAAQATTRHANRRLEEEIKAREKAQEALRQAQKMEAMGQLTGGVAHDFNNLLMVASSGLDLMNRTSDPAKRERLQQGIREAIERGASLTQQLLAFARKTPLKTEVVDLDAQVARMEAVLDRSLREDVTVEIEAQPDLWPVEIDPSQFEVAMLNVALNARDAMPSGGVIRIGMNNFPGVDGAEDKVLVTVSDTGQGMAPEMLSRVFEPFFTTKGVGQGTGLGLSQVYGFANASGGEVRIASQLGRGTTISIILPRSRKDTPGVDAKAAPGPDAATNRGRLLLVEDDDRVAEMVGEMLNELGYQVSRVASAAAALAALRRGPSDLVFSDMVMPGEMSGLDLAREIARTWPDIPVVLTTGYSASAAEAAAEGLRLLSKPYSIEALAAELHAASASRAS